VTEPSSIRTSTLYQLPVIATALAVEL